MNLKLFKFFLQTIVSNKNLSLKFQSIYAKKHQNFNEIK